LLAGVPAPRSSAHRRIGQVIRSERQIQQLTLEELGHTAGMNPRYLAGVERGETNVALENLLRIVTALGITLAEAAERASL
jgi:transcriptional regulator with XRE-family HTH domain